MIFRFFVGILLQLSPFAFLCLAPFRNRFRVSNKKMFVTSLILLLAISGLFSFLSTFLYNRFNELIGEYHIIELIDVAFSFSVILCAVWYFIMIKSHYLIKFFVLIFTTTVGFFITAFLNIIYFSFFYNPDIHLLVHYELSTIIPYFLITSICILPLCHLLNKYFFTISDKLKKKDLVLFLVLSIALLVLYISSYLFIEELQTLQNILFISVFVSMFIMICVVYFTFFYSYNLSIKSREANEKLISAKHYLEINQLQYDNLTHDLNATKKIRHDLRSHLIVMQEFLNQKDYSSLETYLSKYLDSSPELIAPTFCSHNVTNAIISHYYFLAKNNGIQFNVNIKIPAQIDIESSDIAVVLGNLLENALTATSNPDCDNPFITVNILSRGNYVSITTDNSFDGVVKKDGANFISIKENHNGIGLQSITNIANRLGGSAKFTVEKKVFMASVVIGCIYE